MITRIRTHFASLNLDVRRTHYSRFMDQKVTPDVVCFIADCIVNLMAGETEREFSARDIWESQYFEKNVRVIFGKPSPTNPDASNEYDKFLNQPLRMFHYAGILDSRKDGNTYYYRIKESVILEFMSIKERNVLYFLYEYLLKVLTDSGLIRHFEEYERLYHKSKLTENEFQGLKSKFQNFMRGNTPINGVTEINRIFPKVLNIFANVQNLPGSVKGHLSKDIYSFFDLMYNNVNFRDLTKLKSITRQEAQEKKEAIGQQEEFNEYQIQKAMAIIRKKYRESEVRDNLAGTGMADYVHHIFPRAGFPQLAHYLENLIKLNAAQHNKAHPGGNTQVVDKDYQLVCLISKSESIRMSLQRNEFFYSKESFVYVINTGLEASLDPGLTFREIQRELNQIYKYN